MPDPLNYFLIFWTFWSGFLFFSVFPMVSPLYSYIIFHLIHCLPVFIMLNIFAWILCVIHNFIVCFLVVSTYQESLQSVYSSILESPCEGNVVEQHRCWSSAFGAGVLYGQWFESQMLQIRSRTLLLAWDLREMSLGPVLRTCTHVGDPKEAVGSQLWTLPALVLSAVWGNKPADERCFSLSLFLSFPLSQ